jgi:hypothetical protein
MSEHGQQKMFAHGLASCQPPNTAPQTLQQHSGSGRLTHPLPSQQQQGQIAAGARPSGQGQDQAAKAAARIASIRQSEKVQAVNRAAAAAAAQDGLMVPMSSGHLFSLMLQSLNVDIDSVTDNVRQACIQRIDEER